MLVLVCLGERETDHCASISVLEREREVDRERDPCASISVLE